MRKGILFLLVLLTIPMLVDAQRRNRYRWEGTIHLGASNFLGDLGGANRIGTNGLRDLELVLTRPAVGIGVRYRQSRYLGYQINAYYARVNGDDKLTAELYRNNRNLNFRSPIVQLSGQLEFYFTKERQGHVYKIKNVQGWKHIDMQAYAFIGAGAFFFNPQGQYQGGAWYKLQPLGTEGQGLKAGTHVYSRINATIPIGFGLKYALDRRWAIGFEVGMHKTFTDYIDDVSTTYFDNDSIASSYGPMAAYFADPSLHNPAITPVGGSIEITGEGQQRGDPTDNDSYMFVTFSVNYKFSKFKRTKSKF